MSNRLDSPRFERIAVVAKRLGVSERTVYRMSKAKTLPPILKLFDNTVAMDGRAVDEWMLAKVDAANAAAQGAGR